MQARSIEGGVSIYSDDKERSQFVAVPRTITLMRVGSMLQHANSILKPVSEWVKDRWKDVKYHIEKTNVAVNESLRFSIPYVEGYDTAVLMLWKQDNNLHHVQVDSFSVKSEDDIVNVRVPNSEVLVSAVGSSNIREAVVDKVFVRYIGLPSLHYQCRAIADAIVGPLAIISLPEAMVNNKKQILIGKEVYNGGPRVEMDTGHDDWGESYDFGFNVAVDSSSKWVGIVTESKAVDFMATKDVGIESGTRFGAYIIPCPNLHVGVVGSTVHSTSMVIQVVEAAVWGVRTTALSVGDAYFHFGEPMATASRITDAGCGDRGHKCEQVIVAVNGENCGDYDSDYGWSGALSNRESQCGSDNDSE